ncbi:Imm45 family immunity protein [Streptomyces sp. NPDC002215]|uniref:Imm45 family immunity protein n=1 Tax=Streptomyces sp. NPDC002215 TaxID=3154412 RepID=UPI00331E1C44
MKWILLSEHPEEIARGAVFQLPARWPYEETAEFMLAELPPGADDRTGLIVTTGYKDGLWVTSLPDEAYAAGRPWALSASWLRDNWTAKVYVETDLEKIPVCTNYSPSQQHG